MAADATSERRFPAMGSTAHVIVHGGPEGLLDEAVARIEALEAAWSRFRADSDVSRLNAAPPGLDVSVDPSTLVLVERAVDGWRASDGRYDPTLLGELRVSGYDHSLATGAPDAGGPASAPHDDSTDAIDAIDAQRPSADLAFVVDHHAGTVRRTGAAGFDPGGIGKGLAADLVSAHLMARGALGVLVNVGGDLRVRGDAPGGSAWRIDIEDPRLSGLPGTTNPPLTTVALHDGAVATTSRVRRRWVDDSGRPRHHLIDPATGHAAETPVLAATAIAAEGWQAEVLSKTAFLDGLRCDDELARIERLAAAALLVTDDLEAATSRWSQFAIAPEQETV